MCVCVCVCVVVVVVVVQRVQWVYTCVAMALRCTVIVTKARQRNYLVKTLSNFCLESF